MSEAKMLSAADRHERVLDLRQSSPRDLAHVRHWITESLGQFGRTHVADVVQVVDELTSNAYEHGDGPRAIRLSWGRHPCVAKVEVEDSNLGTLTLGASRFGAGGYRGRGLVLVRELSRAWGVRPPAQGCAHKTVWAEVPVPCADSPCGGDCRDGGH